MNFQRMFSMLINFTIIVSSSYNDNDSLEMSLYLLYRNSSSQTLYISANYSFYSGNYLNESKKFSPFLGYL
jgi:hypothetical protein